MILNLLLTFFGAALTPPCHSTHTALSKALQSARALVMRLDTAAEECKVRKYRGSLYGVTAKVELDLRRREALVQLYGIPIGGSVKGKGWLQNAPGADEGREEGGVWLEDELAAKLARRMVTIVNAKLDRKQNTVVVTAIVPFLGEQTIVLHRD